MAGRAERGRRVSRGRLAVATGVAFLLLTAILLAAGGPAKAATPSPGDLWGNATPSREFLKQTTYGAAAFKDAGLVAAGRSHPLINFIVEESPPSVFVNYIVPDDRADDLAAAIPLPDGFRLAKVRILERDPEPRYWISLNVYRVSGITNGMRAEWSVYVDDGSGSPRFMIVQARAAEGSLDPVDVFTWPEPFNHRVTDDGRIETNLRATELLFGFWPQLLPQNYFRSTIRLPDEVDRDHATPTREWAAANDFIYWRNGVNDRTFYNGLMHNASVLAIDPDDVTVTDDTPWAAYVDPEPAHTLVYLNRLEFVIAPWWNVTEPDGLVPEGIRQARLNFKNSLYGGYSMTAALQILLGTAEPVEKLRVESSPPTVEYHFHVPDDRVADFEAALGLPSVFSLAKLHLQDDDAVARHYLSLGVSRVSGMNSGLRADWSVYVDDGGPKPRRLLLERRTTYPAIDPVELQSPPDTVVHTLDGGRIDTRVGDGEDAFVASFGVPAPGGGEGALPAVEWVEAHDHTYWRNGIVDRVFYDGSFANADLISVDPSAVEITASGPWAPYVDTVPSRVWVHDGGMDFAINPWTR